MAVAEAFSGSKLVLLCDGNILVYKRDDKPDIPFPDCWDLPGGGRDGDETPVACALRELYEEFGIVYTTDRIIWSRDYPSWRGGDRLSWFFGGHLDSGDIDGICFGDEGQHWTTMPVADYLAAKDIVPHHRARVQDFLQHV